MEPRPTNTTTIERCPFLRGTTIGPDSPILLFHLMQKAFKLPTFAGVGRLATSPCWSVTWCDGRCRMPPDDFDPMLV